MATEKVLDDDVLAARRRAWLRRALPIVVGLLAIVAVNVGFDAAVGTEVAVTPIWDLPSGFVRYGTGLVVLGAVLSLVASVRSSAAGLDLTFVGPADLLSRSERTWVRQQISAGSDVPADKHAVVVVTARRMSDEGRTLLLRIGQLGIPAGLVLSSPTPLTVVLMAVLVGSIVVGATRDQVWARRARRWLARHA